MAAKGTMRLCVLWEGELRLAAKKLAHVRKMSVAGECDDKEFGRLVKEALDASAAALAGAEDDDASLLLTRPALIRRDPKEGSDVG